MNTPAVMYVSKCFIKPKYDLEESKYPYHLTPWGLSLLSVNYIQSGLLFSKPKPHSITDLLESLTESLSLALVHFYPLSGQFTTWINEHRHECSVFVYCSKGPGAKFIHATSNLSISDILSPTYVPLVIGSFFDLNKVINHYGHSHPLLSIQVTEMSDGIFIGVSPNHAVADGTSLLSFWHAWSEIHRDPNGAKKQMFLSHPPIHNFLFPSEIGHGVPLPITRPDELIIRSQVPKLKERIFHFSAESIKRLKEQANIETVDR